MLSTSRLVPLLSTVLTIAYCGADEPEFVRPEYQVLRTAAAITIDGKLDEPSWISAPSTSDFVFPWWKSGRKEKTVAKLLWDDQNLYIACICSDEFITAKVTERDGPVPQDDCFEIMLVPDPSRPGVYFNIEWNVIGGIVDNFRPRGPKQPRAPKWDAAGIQHAGTYRGTLNDDSDRDQHWITEVAIPFANFKEYSPKAAREVDPGAASSKPIRNGSKLGETWPQAGSTWLVNLNRHGGQTNPQYSQWSPGDTPTPSFHTPHRFGRLIFSNEIVPTGQARRFAFTPLEAIARMQVPEWIQVTPFAAEPDIRQPILVKCDDRGRVWVIQYLQYPNPAGLQRIQVDRWSRTVYDRVPEPPPHGPRGADKITICEDTDADGEADKFVDFVDGLNLCTGLAFGHDGVYVLQVPYLLFYADRNRDDVPDGEPEVLLTGFGMEDAQSFANHLTWGPDGWLYGVNGSTTTCNIRGIEFQQGVWRYHPRSKEFELFCEGGGNLFGLTFDRHGEMFFTSNGGHLCMHGRQGAYYQKAFNKHGPLHNRYAYGYFGDITKTTPVVGGPCTGGTIYQHGIDPSERIPFPADEMTARLSGAFLCGDFLGHTCSWWRMDHRSATFSATRIGTLLAANDPWFGATDICYGPDGAVYVSDFHDRRTAHPDPDANWDRSNGRVYRLASKTAPAAVTIDLAQLDNSQLIDLLKSPSGWHRERARVLLAERKGPEIDARLRELATQSNDRQITLEALWVLFARGRFDQQLASQLLNHPQEYVRSWAVRLLGESPDIASSLSSSLVRLAETDASPIMRAHLAAAARRWPGSVSLPVLTSLMEHDFDPEDLQLSWLLWWAIESKAISDRQQLVDYFCQPATWNTRLARENVLRLIRRYASEATPAGWESCVRLVDAAPADQIPGVIESLSSGLAERSAEEIVIGQGDLFRSTSPGTDATPFRAPARPDPVPGPLRQRIERWWRETPTDAKRTRLALLAGVAEAHEQVLARLHDDSTDDRSKLNLLELLTELGQADCVSKVLPLVSPDQAESVQLAALRVLQRFDQPEVQRILLENFGRAPRPVRVAVSEILLSRAATARAFLEKVDNGQINPADVPFVQLRQVSRHADPELDALVHKHWGRIRAETSEEKLAVMRRLNNDLRVGPGDLQAGKMLFRKHCGTCHRLFGEGEAVGPDLTNTSRQDTEYLLASLVDPSGVVRREYAASTVITTSGQVLNGLIVENVNGRLTIVNSQGVRQQIGQSEIAELRDSEVSLMPEGLPLQFSPRELRDLFRYLQAEAGATSAR